MAILKVGMRRIILPIIGALAVVTAAYAIRVAAARSTAQSTPQGGDNSTVIRFVKDPEMAPSVPDHDISGAALPRANWTGKVVLVNFWATWCPPCREEVPEMISLQRQFGDKLLIV